MPGGGRTDAGRAGLLIVGGGIGGLTLGIALERRGREYTVFEQAPAIDAVGAGLLLAPNATRLLRRLGVLDRILPLGRATRCWRILDDGGRLLREFRLPDGDEPGVSILRADLQQALLTALPAGRVRLAARVNGVAADGDPLVVTLDDGERATAGAVVGADGVHSRVRAGLLGEEPPIYRGYVGWRGVAEWVPPGYEGRLSESWGRGARFGIAPIDRARTYWYASANRPAGWTHPPERRQRDLLDWFGRWHAPIASLIRATPTETILLNDIADHPPRRGWTRGRVTLLGDAAHPMTPNLGQGACSAIEDAWVLGRELSSGVTIEEAFRRYERIRYPRTARLQRQSRMLGMVIQLERPWAVALRRILTRGTPRWMDEVQVRSIFRYDADAV